MNRKKLFILIGFTVFSLLLLKGVKAIDISDCSVLDQAGATYYLTADITNSSSSKCMDITANNIVLDCQGHTIDGIDSGTGIYGFGRTNTIIRNCAVTDWETGIYFFLGAGNTLENLIVNSNNGGGVQLFGGSNTITNVTANFNAQDGIFLTSCGDSNTITNVTANFNAQDGIRLENSGSFYVDNIIANATTNSNGQYGISINIMGNSNTVKDSIIQNNTDYGIQVQGGSEGANSIYNNFFNNTVNWVRPIYGNSWNTSKQAGARIYSPGTEIGGNYWAAPDGEGFSEVCTDADGDGFCDEAYGIYDDNIDWLPLTHEYNVPPPMAYCGVNITSLPYTIYDETIPKHYCLNQDLTATGDTFGVRFFGGEGSILDCLGNNINGTGITLNGGVESYESHVTVQNCNITGFTWGVRMTIFTENVIITNNTISNNADSGIYIDSAAFAGHRINNNTIIDNGGDGIALFSNIVDPNKLTTIINNNTIIDNSGDGIDTSVPGNFNITNNIISNNDYGVIIYQRSSGTSQILTDNIINNNRDNGIWVRWNNANLTITNNTANDNAGSGIILQDVSNANAINNTIKGNTYGIRFSNSYTNYITGGSILDNTVDYYFYRSSSYVTDTNFTDERTIYFDTSAGILLYNNQTTGNTWLRTNVSAATTLTRRLINWNRTLIQWNDSSDSAITARYIITGLLPNKYYFVYNDSVLTYNLSTDSSGDLPSFFISLSSEHEIKVGVEEEPPRYWDASSTSTLAGSSVSFNLRWTDNFALSGYIFSFDNCTGSFQNDSFVQWSGGPTNAWSNVTKAINSTAGCTIRWKVYASDISNNWNVSDVYSFITVPNCSINGYVLNPYTGNLIQTGIVESIVKETSDRSSGNLLNGYFTLDCFNFFNLQNKITLGLMVNTSDEKMGYNQLIVGSGSFAPQTQKCSIKTWHFNGYAVDSSGRYITQGDVTVGVEGVTGTNTTSFTNGIWDIYHSPCLIPGKLYTFKFIIRSGDKRSHMFLNQVAK